MRPGRYLAKVDARDSGVSDSPAGENANACDEVHRPQADRASREELQKNDGPSKFVKPEKVANLQRQDKEGTPGKFSG